MRLAGCVVADKTRLAWWDLRDGEFCDRMARSLENEILDVFFFRFPFLQGSSRRPSPPRFFPRLVYFGNGERVSAELEMVDALRTCM